MELTTSIEPAVRAVGAGAAITSLDDPSRGTQRRRRVAHRVTELRVTLWRELEADPVGTPGGPGASPEV